MNIIECQDCSDVLMTAFQKVDGRLKMHLYPVEVKIGENKKGVIQKAKERIYEAKAFSLLQRL